jgi:hypothetical protein
LLLIASLQPLLSAETNEQAGKARLEINAEEIRASADDSSRVVLQLCGEDLKGDTELLSPYLELSYENTNSSFSVFYRTEVFWSFEDGKATCIGGRW